MEGLDSGKSKGYFECLLFFLCRASCLIFLIEVAVQ